MLTPNVGMSFGNDYCNVPGFATFNKSLFKTLAHAQQQAARRDAEFEASRHSTGRTAGKLSQKLAS